MQATAKVPGFVHGLAAVTASAKTNTCWVRLQVGMDRVPWRQCDYESTRRSTPASTHNEHRAVFVVLNALRETPIRHTNTASCGIRFAAIASRADARLRSARLERPSEPSLRPVCFLFGFSLDDQQLRRHRPSTTILVLSTAAGTSRLRLVAFVVLR